jgi:hypothetical protein
VIDTAKADKAIQAGDVARIIEPRRRQGDAQRELRSHDALGRRPASGARPAPSSAPGCRPSSSLCCVRVYSGALTQIKDQTVEITKTQVAVPGSTQVVVQSEVRGKGEPIKLDYRLDKDGEDVEDHRRQRRRHLAGHQLPLAVRAGTLRRRHRRADQQARRAQQGGQGLTTAVDGMRARHRHWFGSRGRP